MVAIKDFEVPKNCMVCPFCERMGSHLHCPVARTHIDIRYTESRHPDCPLVEIEERKVGKWVKKSQYGNDYCSECNYEYCGYGYPKYCPNCGTKMRGDENE